MDHPVLQLHELALETEELAEIAPPIQRPVVGLGGGLGQKVRQAVIVELHLELFVQAVEEFLLRPAGNGAALAVFASAHFCFLAARRGRSRPGG